MQKKGNKKYCVRHRKGTVYVNFLQKAIDDLRLRGGMTYRDLNKATGIPMMTLWALGNDGAPNRCSPTHRANYERLRDLTDERLGTRTRLMAYPTPRKAKQAARRLRKREDPMVIDAFDLTSRTQLKAVRTAYNEFCNRNSDDEGYVFVYNTDTEQTIVDTLTKKIREEMVRDRTWITKAPDIILLFAKEAGIIGGADEDEDEDDAVEEEPDDNGSEDVEDDEEDEKADTEDPPEVPESPTDDEEDEGPSETVYRIEMLPYGSAGALSTLFQEICNGLQSGASLIELVPPVGGEVRTAAELEAKKGMLPLIVARPSKPSLTVEGLRKRMQVGGDLLNRNKRMAFITENKVPYTGDLKAKAPKELSGVILAWAESRA